MSNSIQPTTSFSIYQTLLGFGIDLAELKDMTSGHMHNDSRTLAQGDVFCAVIGSSQDGRQYIDRAIESGAALILAQCQHEKQHGNLITRKTESSAIFIIQFYRLDFHLFALAKSYYQSPQDRLTVVGVTGTNGKTSTSQIIAKLMESCEKPCAVIGTAGAGTLDALQPLENTTPGPTQLHQLLFGFAQANIQNVAMEVSSHALEQRRITADLVDIAVFTNLSHDHLDYHQTMDKYADAKRQLFTGCAEQIAIINGDDNYGQSWLQNWPQEQDVIVYGRYADLSQYSAYVFAGDISHSADGVEFSLSSHLGTAKVKSSLIGDFNVENLLAAIAVLIAKKVPLTDIVNAVEAVTPIVGRMESYAAPGMPTSIVDYAHTPDALENALLACHQHCQGKLWLVFGCGGDRDKSKRAIMGKVAEQHADHVIVTNDNPRSEIPEMIARDILAGCQHPEKIAVMLDRQQAVISAISQAGDQDMVLMAGKGHEDYVVIGNEKLAYNEREVVRKQYNEAVS